MKKVLFLLFALFPSFFSNAQSTKPALIQETQLSDGRTIEIYSNGIWRYKKVKKPAIEWVSIPGGTFTMGSPETEKGRFNDEKMHKVTLKPFKISKYEITFAQYDAFCEATGKAKVSDNDWGRDNYPATRVTWAEAKAFAEWMGGRLPTEAEWEYACRAGTTTIFSTGGCLSDLQANYKWDSYADCPAPIKSPILKTLPVGSYAANPWGLYDMHGNVWEWCSDWHGSYDETKQFNPVGPDLGNKRIIRGGAWRSPIIYCRSANRGMADPNYADSFIGFRIVMK